MLFGLFLQLLVNNWDGTEDETADGVLLLGFELGHLVDFEFEELEGVLYVLDVLELLALHTGMEESDGIIITHSAILPQNNNSFIIVDERKSIARHPGQNR